LLTQQDIVEEIVDTLVNHVNSVRNDTELNQEPTLEDAGLKPPWIRHDESD